MARPLAPSTASRPGLHLDGYCKAAGIRSLRVTNLKIFKMRTNICRRRQSTAVRPFIETLDQFRQLHQRAQEALKREAALPIRGGVRVIIKGNAAGHLGSSCIGRLIEMGVFRDWPGGRIDAPTYVHEIGHLIAANPDQSMGLFSALSATWLLTEPVADLLALSAVDTLSPEISALQRFPWINRVPSSQYSYFAANSLLDGKQFMYELFLFCQSVAQSKQAAAIDRHFCSSSEVRDGYAIGVVKHLESSPFDPAIGRKLSSGYFIDPHAAGFPIVSFLHEFKTAASLKFSPLLELLTSNNDQAIFFAEYACSSDKIGMTNKTRLSKQVDLRKMFAILRSNYIKTVDLELFDNLWQKYGMNIGMEFADNLAQSFAEIEAFRFFGGEQVFCKRSEN